MFFSIGAKAKSNFSHFHQFGPFVISTDAGWQRHDADNYICLYKGYVDSGTIESLLDQIAQQTEPLLYGNFCMLVYYPHRQILQVQTDRWRSFPIYVEQHSEVNNLVPLSSTAWTDSMVTINQDLSVEETKFDAVGSINTDPISLEQLLDAVANKLNQKTQQFLEFNRLPVKVFLSGGVDTLLVYSFLQKFTTDYNLVKGNILEYDRFWLQNSSNLSRFWAYNQIHHWVMPCVLTSGAPGDEFMLRSPTTADLYLKYHGIKITDLLKQKTWLHSAYFSKDKHLNLFHDQTVDTGMSTQQLHWHLCNIVLNDWQHWHLGNTLTWTPLRDLDIFKLFLRLPPDVAVEQVMNSGISRELIERNRPGLTALISDQKNTGNSMKNLCDFLFQSS